MRGAVANHVQCPNMHAAPACAAGWQFATVRVILCRWKAVWHALGVELKILQMWCLSLIF